MKWSAWEGPIKPAAVLVLLGMSLACSLDPPPTEDHFLSRDELVLRLAQIQVGLDRVRPQLVAVQGKSFQLGTVDQLSAHVSVVARRLPPNATEEERLAGAVGVNLAGLGFDTVRLDADATAIGLGGVVHRTSLVSMGTLLPAMDAFAADPTWANRHVDEAQRLVYRVALQRDNAVEALGYAQIGRAGVQAAATANGALGLAELSMGGAAALTRLVHVIRSGGTGVGALAVTAEGGVAVMQLTAAGRSIVLTEAEIAALVHAGILSLASWNLMLMASGKPKQVDPERFQNWVNGLAPRPAERGKPAYEFQVKHCGEKEHLAMSENGKQIWVDGVRAKDATLLEAKYVGTPERSPYRSESAFPDKLRAKIRNEQLEQLLRYADVIRDPGTPATSLEIITNDPGAVRYFTELLDEAGIPGRVVLKP